jgi:tetratricopeptide (TPR) repeat protein
VAEGRGQGPRRGDKPRGGGQGGRSAAGGGGPRSGGGAPGGSRGASRGGPAPGGRDAGSRRSDGTRGQGGRAPRDDRRGDRRDERDDRRIRPRDEAERSAEQAKYDGPPLDPEITGKELDRNVAQQLRGLPEKLAARVARHLVAAGMLLDEDPKTAYQHTLAARARAARIAVVREACGEAAYYAGEYAEALAELRAAKRMNGNTEYLPVMADCERALGRPEKALALARNPSVANLEDSLKAEMTIVEAGARRDLGELDAALRTLENAPLRSRSRADWVARLRYAYADTLLAAGRREEAVVWFHRTVGVDANEVTDASERLAELESSGS